MTALVTPFARAIRPGGLVVDPAPGDGDRTSSPTAARQRTVCEFLVPALLSDSDDVVAVVDRLAAYVDENVRCVSPALCTTSRVELISALVDGDDVVTNPSVALSELALVGRVCFAEWAMQGRFTHPAFLHDDVLIEASGRVVTASGVMVLTFVGDRVGDIRCYYDPIGLHEQLLGIDGDGHAGR